MNGCRWFIFLIFLLGWNLTSFATLYILPMEFKPYNSLLRTSGSYNVPIYLGSKKQKIMFVIDTGSSNLNVMGKNTSCQHCWNPKMSYLPGEQATQYNAPYDIQYYFGNSKLQAYRDVITLPSQDAKHQYEFSVYINAAQLGNILGLAYPDLANPNDKPVLPYFDQLVKNEKVEDTISILMCDIRGKSKLVLGGIDPSLIEQQIDYVPITEKNYYLIKFLAVKDKKTNKLITVFDEFSNKAIVDTGTTDAVILPVDQFKDVVDYIRRNSSEKNKALPNAFWQREICINKDQIDYAGLPTFQFEFPRANKPGETILLNMTPEQYLSTTGCHLPGDVAFAFKPNKYGHPVLSLFGIPAESKSIIGLPFLNRYHLVIHRDHNARIGFIENDSLCQKVNE